MCASYFMGFALLSWSVQFLAIPPAHAAPPPLPPGKAKHVCDTPAAGAVRCHADIRTDDNLNPLATSGPAGYGPADLRNAYGITADGTATIAIVDALGTPTPRPTWPRIGRSSGCRPVRSANGCFRKLNQAGQPSPLPADNISWSQETALDLDMASAICPGCNLLLVEANSNSLNDLSTAVTTAGRLGAHAISNSYGAAESQIVCDIRAEVQHPGRCRDGEHWRRRIRRSVSGIVTARGRRRRYESYLREQLAGLERDRVEWHREWLQHRFREAVMAIRYRLRQAHRRRRRGGRRSKHRSRGVCAGSAGSSGWYVFGGTSVGAPIIAAAYAINGGPVNYAADALFAGNRLERRHGGVEWKLRNLPLHSRGRI